MKALSIHPSYAAGIFSGIKTVECRTWRTDYRGDIVICSTAKKIKHTIPGHALCVAKLADIVPFTRKHLKPAMMVSSEYRPGLYAWLLEDIRIIEPVPVKGKLSLWTYDGPINYIEPPKDDKEDAEQYARYWEPITI